jgi:hypothetical protein
VSITVMQLAQNSDLSSSRVHPRRSSGKPVVLPTTGQLPNGLSLRHAMVARWQPEVDTCRTKLATGRKRHSRDSIAACSFGTSSPAGTRALQRTVRGSFNPGTSGQNCILLLASSHCESVMAAERHRLQKQARRRARSSVDPSAQCAIIGHVSFSSSGVKPYE